MLTSNDAIEHRTAVRQCLHEILYLCRYPVPEDGKALRVTLSAINHHFGNIHRIVHDMTAKTKKASTNFAPPNDLKWINRNLTQDEVNDHNAKEKSPAELGKLLFSVAFNGYNIRIAYDDYSKCFQANLIPFQPENPNFGYAISARGVTPQRAVSLLLYKHYAIFEEQWASHYQAPRGGFEG